MTDKPASEFSRPIPLDRIGIKAETRKLVAGEAERAALAERFGLEQVERLEAQVRLRRVRGGNYVRLDAELAARVVQSCVVTLDPVPADIAETFHLLFGPIEQAEAAEDDVLVDLDTPEPIDGAAIDIGEAVAQQLSLSLDPYPHAPGAALPQPVAEAAEKPQPFAALARLRSE